MAKASKKAKSAKTAKTRKSAGVVFKLHERRDSQGVTRSVLAACDAELLGRIFSAKNGVLDLKTYESFYNGEQAKGDQAVELMRSTNNLNLVGAKSIALAKKAFEGLNEKNVKKIKGVPHLQVYRIA